MTRRTRSDRTSDIAAVELTDENADTAISGGEGFVAFDDLGAFDQLVAVIFMGLMKMLPQDSDFGADTFQDILGFDTREDYQSFRQNIRQDDWSWREDHNFRNFDASAAATVVGGEDNILDLIAEHESNGNYDIVYGGREPVLADGRDLTDMTIDEVLDWQDSYVEAGSASSAAGRYQIIRGTLRGLKEEMGLSGDELFDETMQDRMATQLLSRRGYQEFLNGDMSQEQFARNLSMEWASLPKDFSNRSYYAGDGLNAAGTDFNTVLATLDNERTSYASRVDGLATDTRTEAPLNISSGFAVAAAGETVPSITEEATASADVDDLDNETPVKTPHSPMGMTV